MKLSNRLHIQQEGQGKTWFATLQAIDCSLTQAVDIITNLQKIAAEKDVALSDSMNIKTIDRESWTVIFTFKGFSTIDDVKAFLKNLPKTLAVATGNNTLDSTLIQE